MENNYSLTASYNVGIAQECGITSAILYNYLVFWSDKGNRKDGWIWKSAKNITEETGLTKHQAVLARDKLIAGGWIKEKKMMANGSPTMHFKVMRRLDVKYSKVKKPEMESQKTGNQKVKKPEIHNSNIPVVNNSRGNSSFTDLNGRYKRTYQALLGNQHLLAKEYPDVDVQDEVYKLAFWYQEKERDPGNSSSQRMKKARSWLDKAKPSARSSPKEEVMQTRYKKFIPKKP